MNFFEFIVFAAVIFLCLELRKAFFGPYGFWGYLAAFALGIAILATLLFTIDRVANKFERRKAKRKP